MREQPCEIHACRVLDKFIANSRAIWVAETDNGRRMTKAKPLLELASVTTGAQGKVDLVPPRAIHAEQGGPTRSVAIIVRSQKLGEGTALQHRYDRGANTVVEQYGPTQIPYAISSPSP